MISKPQGYDAAQAIEGNGGPRLEPGGYVCRILRVQEQMSKSSGKPMIVFEFDINEGTHRGFYTQKYKQASKTNPTAKWGGVLRQSVSSEYGVSRLKGMITAIENSNGGFKFNWDDPQNEKLLAGKLVGVVFGEEEYMYDQEVKTAVKPFWMCSVDKIREGVEIPKKKALKPQQDLMGGYLDEDFHLIPEGDDDVPF